MTPEVTIGIPAYNAEAFLRETVESALTQTWPAISVLISVDRSDDGTAVLAESLARERGVTTIVQPARLGWVGNSNAVLAAARTPFAMILPHDDRLEPGYVEACMKRLQASPDAVAACTDIRVFGDGSGKVAQTDLRGPLPRRLARMIADSFPAVAYRAVIDMDRLDGRFIPTIASDDFAADTLWVARLCIAGEVVRVPEPLYWKRAHGASAHLRWKGLSPRAETERWLAHVADLEAVVAADAPELLRLPAIRDALAVRARRAGRAHFESREPIGGLATIFPLWRARLARRRLGR